VDLAAFFDRVVVINLNRRPDRRERFEQHLSAVDWPFAPPQRVEAIDGRLHAPPPWWRAGRGAWGCHRTMVGILETALADGVERMLVLEDDVCFVSDLRERAARFLAAVPDDWDQIYLGGQHLVRRPARHTVVNAEVVRPFDVNRGHAFGVRRRFLAPLHRHLADLTEHARFPRLHVDHRMGQLHRTGRFEIYAPVRWLAGQVEGRSDISERWVPQRFWNE
jgi:hypothetical protein